MEVDIRIYLKRLKDFFESDEEARRDMFGNSTIDMKLFYKMVADKAAINAKKNGDPMLTGDEMLDIVTDLAFNEVREELDVANYIKNQEKIQKLFIHFKDGFPPICLN